MLSTPPTNKQRFTNNDGTPFPQWYIWFTTVYQAIVGLITSFETVTAISTGSVTLSQLSTTYVNSGAAVVWTLPDMASYKGKIFFIKNRGSGSITLNRSGTDQIYTTLAVNSITIAAGASAMIQSDGVYWLSM